MGGKEIPDLLKLSGEGWLRLCASGTNVTVLAGWCERCRDPHRSGAHCPWCSKPLVKLNPEFWQKVGQKIRRALVKNHSLLPEVKTAWKKLYGHRHYPIFPAEMEWLKRAWASAGQPAHRPFDPKVRYAVANWVRTLQQQQLSQEEIIDVMTGAFDKHDVAGPITRGKKDYGNISVQDLRKLSQEFKNRFASVPGSLVNREEMWRTLEWVDRQRANPMARLRGERVRDRSAKDGPHGQNTTKND